MDYYGPDYQPVFPNSGHVQCVPDSAFQTYSKPHIHDQAHTGGNTYLTTPQAGQQRWQVRPLLTIPTVPSQNCNNFHHLQHPNSSVTRFSRDQELYDTEDQDCPATGKSEPMNTPMDGYPDVDAFDILVESYVKQLSPKKRDKALIDARRAEQIRIVLLDKKTTSVGSAQFRFWVKKMFTLLPRDPNSPNGKRKICHDNKPVAVREKLFIILSKAHLKSQHGGRDKTSAQVRKTYSWVPKELISRFVKICPTCQGRRTANKSIAADDETSQAGNEAIPDSSSTLTSPTNSRHGSFATNFTSSAFQSPVSMEDQSQVFQNQNRWMTDIPTQQDYEASIMMTMNHMR